MGKAIDTTTQKFRAHKIKRKTHKTRKQTNTINLKIY
jgi:hypothetical protein